MSTVETDIDRPAVVPETLRTKSYRYAIQDWAASNALSHPPATERDETNHNQQELSAATERVETLQNQQELSAGSLCNRQQSNEEPPPTFESSPLTDGNEPGESPHSAPDHAKDTPPSYESLYGRVRAAKRESSGFADFMLKVAAVLTSTWGYTICLAIGMAIPISMVVIGSLKINMCPIERYIPIYLIVSGAFTILRSIISLIRRICNRQEQSEETNQKKKVTKMAVVDSLVGCFLAAWFIAGNVWIYRVTNSWSSDPTDVLNYCDPTLYLFAFWLTTSGYILAVGGCVCACGCGIICFCVARDAE